MREIKFRLIKGKKKNRKIVGYEWHKPTRKGIVILHNTDNSDDIYLWFRINTCNGLRYISHDDKEQYTGYNDIDNNELYENENIIITSDGDDEQHKSIIQWIDGGFCVDTGDLLNEYDLHPLGRIFDWASIKIINIHENPKLLPELKSQGKGEG